MEWGHDYTFTLKQNASINYPVLNQAQIMGQWNPHYFQAPVQTPLAHPYNYYPSQKPVPALSEPQPKQAEIITKNKPRKRKRKRKRTEERRIKERDNKRLMIKLAVEQGQITHKYLKQLRREAGKKERSAMKLIRDCAPLIEKIKKFETEVIPMAEKLSATSARLMNSICTNLYRIEVEELIGAANYFLDKAKQMKQLADEKESMIK